MSVEDLRVLSDQRMSAWERVVSEWLAGVLDRRLRSLRQRLEQVWTPEGVRALREENERVGRRARLDTFTWPEYLRAVELPVSLEGKSEERDYLKDTDRWRAEIEREGMDLFERIFERAEEATREALPALSLPPPDAGDALTGVWVGRADDPLQITSPRREEYGGPRARLDGADLLQREGVRSILNQRLQWALSSTENRVDQILDAVLAPGNEDLDLREVWNSVSGTVAQRRLWGRVAGNALAASTLNAALLEASAAAGLQYKRWLSSRDDRVRWTHARPLGDGQTVGIRESFTIGGIPLQYPGDPAAFAYGRRGMKQIYGCRCTLLVSADAELFAEPPEPSDWSQRGSARGAAGDARDEAELQEAAGLVKVSPIEAIERISEVLRRRPGWNLPGGRWLSTAAQRLGVPRAMFSGLVASMERWAMATALGDALAAGFALQQVGAVAQQLGFSQAQADSIVETLQASAPVTSDTT